MQIARLAGCSQAYVSRVLHGYICSPQLWDVISRWLTRPQPRAEADMVRSAASRMEVGGLVEFRASDLGA